MFHTGRFTPFPVMAKNIDVLLDREKGIRSPTQVRVDDDGKSFAIIHKEDGSEIRNYKLNMVIFME